jgi:hypothetical protein
MSTHAETLPTSVSQRHDLPRLTGAKVTTLHVQITNGIYFYHSFIIILVESRKIKDNFLYLDDREIITWILKEIGCEGVKCIQLAQDSITIRMTEYVTRR